MSKSKKLLEPDISVWDEAFTNGKSLDFTSLLEIAKKFHQEQLEIAEKNAPLVAAGKVLEFRVQKLMVDAGLALHVFDCLLVELLNQKKAAGVDKRGIEQNEAYKLVDIRGRLAAARGLLTELIANCTDSNVSMGLRPRFESVILALEEIHNSLVRELFIHFPMTEFAHLADWCRDLYTDHEYAVLKGASLRHMAEELG